MHFSCASEKGSLIVNCIFFMWKKSLNDSCNLLLFKVSVLTSFLCNLMVSAIEKQESFFSSVMATKQRFS